MDKIFKLVTAVKDLGESQLEVICSTEEVDRDGDVIRANGWDLKNYKDNPIVLWAHDYHSPPIGKSNKIWVDKSTKTLRAVMEFATTDFAQEIYSLYQGKFLNAFSVGFIAQDYKYIEGGMGRDFLKNELLEFSCVPVPANAGALAVARSKGLNVDAVMELLEHGEECSGCGQCECGDEIETEEPPETVEDVKEPEEPFEEPVEDTPVEDVPADEKSGRVLSQANFDKLGKAQTLLQTVLDSATPQDAVEPEEEKEPTLPDPEPEKAFDTSALLAELSAALGGTVSAEVDRAFRKLTGKLD